MSEAVKCCRSCEYFDAGGEIAKLFALDGDCLNPNSDRFTPEYDHVCGFWLADSGGQTKLTFEMIAADVVVVLRQHNDSYDDGYYKYLVTAMYEVAESLVEDAKDEMRKPGAV